MIMDMTGNISCQSNFEKYRLKGQMINYRENVGQNKISKCFIDPFILLPDVRAPCLFKCFQINLSSLPPGPSLMRRGNDKSS